MMTAITIYLGIVLVMSLACIVAYGWDKRSAANGSRRVPEQTLHIMAFLGGWPGALLGQRHFRHKDEETVVLDRLLVRRCAARCNSRYSGVCALWLGRLAIEPMLLRCSNSLFSPQFLFHL